METTPVQVPTQHPNGNLCPPHSYLFKKHKCQFCTYRSNHRWLVRDHMIVKHSHPHPPIKKSQTKKQKKKSISNSVSTTGNGDTITSAPTIDDNTSQEEIDKPSSIPLVNPDLPPSSNPSPQPLPPSIPSPILNQKSPSIPSPPLIPSPSSIQKSSIQTTPSIKNKNDQLNKITPQHHVKKNGVIISNEGSVKLSIEEKEGPFDVRLIKDFKIFISGPSRSGKSSFVYNLFLNLNQFASHQPDYVIYVYSVWQESLDDLKNEEMVDVFIQGNNEIENDIKALTRDYKSPLIIFDDQMNHKPTLEYAARLFTVEGRHSGKSCLWISQNLFDNGSQNFTRTIRKNSDYIIIFRCPGDCLDIQNLSKQMTSNMLLYNIYQHVTNSEPYTYLMINITQKSIDKLKFMSHIFKEDGLVRVYVPQKK